MTLEQHWQVVKRWWWLFIASTLVATASSYYSVSKAPRIYQAATTIIVGQGLNKPDPTYQDFSISQQLAQTYVNMVRRQPILQGASRALGLSFVPSGESVSAQIIPGTQLVEIRVLDTSPERARALADEIAQQLILQTPNNPAENRERRDFIQRQLQTLEENIQATELEIEEEQARLDAANSARAIQQYQNNIDALQDKLAAYQSNYAAMMQTEQGGTNYISVVEPAAIPTQPVSPNVPETLMLAAAIGLALAVGGAYLIEFLDNTIKTPEDVKRVTGLTILGHIPRIEGREYRDQLVALRSPTSSVAEAFRSLRTSLDYSAVTNPAKSLLLTSASPFEGKSITIANLAIVMAQSGRTVTLIDADMRRPSLHKIFGMENHRGLSNAILERNFDLSAYGQEIDLKASPPLRFNGEVHPTSDLYAGDNMGTLRVVTAGPLPPNPSDLLGSKPMTAIVAEAAKHSEMVLLDTPPVMAASDASVLSRLADGVLVLIDAGHTKTPMIQRALEHLRQIDAPIVGAILNHASTQRGYYAYDYYGDRKAGQQEMSNGKEPRFRLPSFRTLMRPASRKSHRSEPTSQPASDPEPLARS